MAKKLETVRKDIVNYGFWNAVNIILLKLINKIVTFQVNTCMVISTVNESFLKIDPKFEHGFAEIGSLMKYSLNKENELPQDFVQAATDKGDECYAITDNGNLASYGWYSHKPTIVDLGQLFCFNPSYVYMYKGYTKKDYRGQRLHAVGMSFALKHYLDNGLNGIASCVESTNFESLKSCWRMGYKKVGTVYTLKIFGKVFNYSTRSCKEYGIYFKDGTLNSSSNS